MTSALVNKIIPSSVVDGPGNRTAIFLQGCNISCGYCHNPETQNVCCNCGACIEGCPVGALSRSEGSNKVRWDAASCINCDHCIHICEYHATPKVQEMTACEVFAKVEASMPFIRGITVSGGECTLYPEFLKELFQHAKQAGLTCLLDTNGTMNFEEQEELLEVCDGVMLDIKAWDTSVYRALTGGENAVVKKNLKFLAAKDKLEEIRIVYLPGMVDAKEVIVGLAARLLPRHPGVRLKLIKFRNAGVKGACSHLESPSDEQMQELKRYAQEFGFHNILIV